MSQGQHGSGQKIHSSFSERSHELNDDRGVRQRRNREQRIDQHGLPDIRHPSWALASPAKI